MEFVRSPADPNSEFDLNIIIGMNQVGIADEVFSREMRRLYKGKDSLLSYFESDNEFIVRCMRMYLLSSRQQRLFFWSHMLCIAAKIKQIDIDVENQLVTIPRYQAFSRGNKDNALSFDQGEVRDEQNDAMLYNGFLVPPMMDGERATSAGDKLSMTVRGLKSKVKKMSKTRVLRKATVRRMSSGSLSAPSKLKRDVTGGTEEETVWYHTADGEQYEEPYAVMFRFV